MAVPATPTAPLGPPLASVGFLGWMQRNLFSNIWNTMLTLGCIYLLVRIVPPLFDWLVFEAMWRPVPPDACRQVEGACWAIVHEKHRVILFGRYPYYEQWRPLLGILFLLSTVLTSCFRRFWRPWIAWIWIGGLGAFFVVMWGGDIHLNYRSLAMLAGLAAGYAALRVRGPRRAQLLWLAALMEIVFVFGGAIVDGLDGLLGLTGAGPFFAGIRALAVDIPTGLSYIPTSLWGGLPLTLLLSIVGIVASFPIAILLALGRRSHMPIIRNFCIAYIELIRGVPLVSLLFVASFLLPLFLPSGVQINDLLRAQVAIIMFSAAYLAEVIRGGLQAIPRGQYEAADALGLGYWQKMGKIVLPQAITLVIPPIVNTFIGLFKDTSLVSIVGLTDLLLATKDLAIADVEWRRYYAEAYIFTALIYFVFCFFMSQYSQYLERQFETGRQKRR